jgi:hypothetical protein
MVPKAAMLRRILFFTIFAVAAFAQKYAGPVPPKPDLVYLKHASDLVPTEAVTAKEEKKKDDSTYTMDGASSPVATPLASPVFLIKAEKLNPDQLGLFKLDVKNGHREIFFPAKKPPKPIRLDISRLTPDGIWKIEVNESLEPGEYSLSPQGSNQVFCFKVR